MLLAAEDEGSNFLAKRGLGESGADVLFGEVAENLLHADHQRTC